MIIHHHLGLGDHFVCNGLVNYIAKISSEPIDLICKKQNLAAIEYLYSENKQIIIIPIEGINEILEVNTYAIKTGKKLLRVGFNHCDPKNWDRSFYDQLNIDFIERYRFFQLPKNKPINLIKVPNIPYVLIHNESSEQRYNISINNNGLKKIYLDKQAGFHILSYIDIIMNAEEIHCIDSSFFHLIDSLTNVTNQLYFHDIRRIPVSFNKSIKWNTISYHD